MFGQKETLLLIVASLIVVDAGKRNAQCDFVCQGKMTIECCECIGCHQGMRFGKRSSALAIDFEPFGAEFPRTKDALPAAQWSGDRFFMHPRQVVQPTGFFMD